MGKYDNEKKNYKGGKPNKGGKGKDKKDFRKDDKVANKGPKRMEDCTTNDINWWNRSPIYTLATSVQYNKMPGYPYAISRLVGDGASANVLMKSNPGVFVLEYYPTIGRAVDANSPVNLAFNTLYNTLVAATNSANIGFQAMDLAMITLAGASCITQIAEIERILMLSNAYTFANADYPRAILAGLDIDHEDLALNKASYVMQLQMLVRNFNALSFVNYLTLFERNMQLGRNIYLDDDSAFAQIKVFKSLGYYTYMDTQSAVYFNRYDTTKKTLQYKIDCLYNSLELIRNTGDFGLIMGAVRRAFPESGVIELNIPDGMEVINPVNDRNVNWQFNNAVLVPGVTSLGVTQSSDKNYLRCLPRCEGQDGLKASAYEWILNSYDGTIGDEFIMESTRFMVHATRDTELEFQIDACGTEIASQLCIVEAVFNEDQEVEYTKHYIGSESYSYNNGQRGDSLAALAALTKCKNHPGVQLYSVVLSSDELQVLDTIYEGEFRDLYVWTSINKDQLQYIHRAALESAYGIYSSVSIK